MTREEIELRIKELEKQKESVIGMWEAYKDLAINDNPVGMHTEIINDCDRRIKFLRLYLEEIIN